MPRIFDCKIRQERLEATKEYRAKRAQEQNELSKFRKERGLCVRCGKKDAVIGITLCQSCREKYNAKRRKSIKVERIPKKRVYKPKTKEEIAKEVVYNRKRRERRAALGLCTMCGKKKALPGLMTCTYCRMKRNQATSGYVDHTHKWYEKERRLGRLNG